MKNKREYEWTLDFCNLFLGEQVLRSTGSSSTIQIEEKIFDNLQSCDLRLGFSSTWEQ